MTSTDGRTLVVPSEIPGLDVRASDIRDKADLLTSSASTLTSVADGIRNSWERPLSQNFEGPSAPVAWTAMNKPSDDLAVLAQDLTTASTALSDYADLVEKYVTELKDLHAEAVTLAEEIGVDGHVWIEPVYTSSWSWDSFAVGNVPYYRPGTTDPLGATQYLLDKGATARTADGWRTEVYVPWEEVPDLCERNDLVLVRIGDAVGRWHEAEADCATTLRGLLQYICEADPTVHAAPRNTFYAPGTAYPWGALPSAPPQATGVAGFFDALVDQGVGTFNGLTALLFGHNANTQRWFTGDAYTQSWGALGQGFSAAGTIATITPTQYFERSFDADEVHAAQYFADAFQDSVAWDTWSENPGYAAGTALPGVIAAAGGGWGALRQTTTTFVPGHDPIWRYPNGPGGTGNYLVGNAVEYGSGPRFGVDRNGVPLASITEWFRHYGVKIVSDPTGDSGALNAWFELKWDSQHPDGFLNGHTTTVSVKEFEELYGNRYVDRGGAERGTAFGALPDGIPATLQERAAGYQLAMSHYHRYELTPHAQAILDKNQWEIRVGEIAPNLGMPGGGKQTMFWGKTDSEPTPRWLSAEELIAEGVLVDATKTA